MLYLGIGSSFDAAVEMRAGRGRWIVIVLASGRADKFRGGRCGAGNLIKSSTKNRYSFIVNILLSILEKIP